MRRGIREFLWVAAPKVASGALQLFFSLVLLRYLPPSQFGALSVCIAAVLLGDSIIGGATDSGVLNLAPLYHATDRQRSVDIQRAGLLLKPLIAAVVVLPVLVLAPVLSGALFQNSSHTGLIYTSVAALLGLLLLRSAQLYFQVGREFGSYGSMEILHALLKFGALSLLIGTSRPTPERVLAIYALAPLTVAAGVLVATGRVLFHAQSPVMVILLSLANKVKWYLATATMGTLVARMDIFLVSNLSGVSEAGIFSAAQSIALVPQLLGSYIAVVFSPRIMPMFEKGTLLGVFRKFQSSTWLVAAALYLIALVGWTRVAALLFPSAFQTATETVLILLPAGLTALVNFPLTILVLLFLRPRFMLGLDLLICPIVLLLYVLVIPKYGARGAAVVTSVAALFKTVVMHRAVLKTLEGKNGAHSETAAAGTLGGVC